MTNDVKLRRRRIMKVLVVDDLADETKEDAGEKISDLKEEKVLPSAQNESKRWKLLGFAVKWRVMVLIFQVCMK